MADDVMKTTRTRKNDGARRLLNAELDDIAARLQRELEVPATGVAAGADFFDVAQAVEHQELVRLQASRLVERAWRLRTALTRVADGEYGVCSECRASIPPKRLLAVPDASTCVACQEQLERAG